MRTFCLGLAMAAAAAAAAATSAQRPPPPAPDPTLGLRYQRVLSRRIMDLGPEHGCTAERPPQREWGNRSALRNIKEHYPWKADLSSITLNHTSQVPFATWAPPGGAGLGNILVSFGSHFVAALWRGIPLAIDTHNPMSESSGVQQLCKAFDCGFPVVTLDAHRNRGRRFAVRGLPKVSDSLGVGVERGAAGVRTTANSPLTVVICPPAPALQVLAGQGNMLPPTECMIRAAGCHEALSAHVLHTVIKGADCFHARTLQMLLPRFRPEFVRQALAILPSHLVSNAPGADAPIWRMIQDSIWGGPSPRDDATDDGGGGGGGGGGGSGGGGGDGGGGNGGGSGPSSSRRSSRRRGGYRYRGYNYNYAVVHHRTFDRLMEDPFRNMTSQMNRLRKQVNTTLRAIKERSMHGMYAVSTLQGTYLLTCTVRTCKILEVILGTA